MVGTETGMNKRTDGKAFDPATAVEFTAPINADAADADIVANAPATGPEPATPEAAGPAPAGRRRLARLKAALPYGIAALATFASLVATIGLVIASRNTAEAGQRIAALERAVDGLSTIPLPIAERAAPLHPALPSAAADMPADEAGAPATAAQMRAALDDFRRDLVRYQALGSNAAWVDAIRDAQAELANRINSIAEKVDRIDRRINGGRPALPAADRARPS